MILFYIKQVGDLGPCALNLIPEVTTLSSLALVKNVEGHVHLKWEQLYGWKPINLITTLPSLVVSGALR